MLGKRSVPPALQNLHHRLLNKTIQHRRDAKLSHPAVRLLDFRPSYRLRLIGSTQQLFPDGWPMLLQVSRKVVNGHSVRPGVPFVRLDSCQCLQFSRSQNSSINCSPMARLSVLRFAANDSVPSSEALGASLLLSSWKLVLLPLVAH